MSEKKVILIIGASRGLGLALAEEYCHLGWHVVATSRGHSTGLDARHSSSLISGVVSASRTGWPPFCP